MIRDELFTLMFGTDEPTPDEVFMALAGTAEMAGGSGWAAVTTVTPGEPRGIVELSIRWMSNHALDVTVNADTFEAAVQKMIRRLLEREAAILRRSC